MDEQGQNPARAAGTRIGHTSRGFDRLVNFSDAVVAIAITLLVLPLTEVASQVGGGESVPKLLQDNQSSIVAFLVSFVLVANYWLVHHRMFEFIDDYDGPLAWLNMLWLLLIILLPFSTELISDGFVGEAALIYSGNLALLSLVLGILGWHVTRHPELQAPDFQPARMRLAKSILYFVVFLLIGVAAQFMGSNAAWLFFLLFPINLVLDRLGWDD